MLLKITCQCGTLLGSIFAEEGEESTTNIGMIPDPAPNLEQTQPHRHLCSQTAMSGLSLDISVGGTLRTKTQ